MESLLIYLFLIGHQSFDTANVTNKIIFQKVTDFSIHFLTYIVYKYKILKNLVKIKKKNIIMNE